MFKKDIMIIVVEDYFNVLASAFFDDLETRSEQHIDASARDGKRRIKIRTRKSQNKVRRIIEKELCGTNLKRYYLGNVILIERES